MMKKTAPLSLLFLGASLLLAMPGCSDGGGSEDDAGDTGSDSGTDTSDVILDEAAILAAVADYPNSFVKINGEPFVSQHAAAASVNIYVQPEVADHYKSIDPMNPMATSFTEGTIIVKEHLDANMAVSGGTVMYKAPGGYDPEHNDWWYGQGDLQGGQLNVSGVVDTCIGCHQSVAVTDYLYGIPVEQQAP